MKPYEKYVPSGVEWIGDIPEGWQLEKLKYISQLRINKTEDSELIYIALEHIESNTGKLLKKEDDDAQPDAECLVFCAGDVLFCKLRPYLAKCILARFKGKCSSELLVLQSKTKLIPQYLFFVALSHGFLEIVNSSTYGSKMPRANWNFIGNMPIALPNPDTQTAIAAYLDRETARIDNIIKAKETLIDRLKEKRTALISHAVTKGLDPTAKMKPSGVEWIGDIPEGWAVKKLKYLGDAIIGLTYSPENVVTSENDGVLVFRSSNVQNGKITYDDNVYVDVKVAKKLMVKSGDILICSRNGSKALIGKNALISEDDERNTFGAFMAIFRSSSYRFLHYVFNSNLFEVQADSCMTTTVNQLTTGNLNSMQVAIPRKDAQTAIANYLDTETAKIDTTIEKTKLSIEKLKEYRTALISACVTGKINVRSV